MIAQQQQEVQQAEMQVQAGQQQAAQQQQMQLQQQQFQAQQNAMMQQEAANANKPTGAGGFFGAATAPPTSVLGTSTGARGRFLIG